jgi:sarcosine oxidase delta subunit
MKCPYCGYEADDFSPTDSEMYNLLYCPNCGGEADESEFGEDDGTRDV